MTYAQDRRLSEFSRRTQPAGPDTSNRVTAGLLTAFFYGLFALLVWRAFLGGPTGTTVTVEGLPPLRNDLEPAAQHVEPRLVAFKAAVERAGGAPALLAGSGSSYAVVFGTIAAAEEARTRIAEAVAGQVVVGLTVDAGVRERL